MSQKAEVKGSNNIVVQIEGDRNQVNIKGLPHLTLSRYLTRRSIENDADILAPYSFSIPMIGRDDELAALGAWLDNSKPISVRVMTGRAGAGKTRLALELIEARLEAGWDAGVVTSRELDRFFAQQNLRNWGWQRPTLVVIDYAASHAEAIYGWLAELSDHGSIDGRPLRLLLLERSANQEVGWWRTAFGYSDGTAKAIQRLLDPAQPIALPPIDERERRRKIFQAALKRGQNSLNAPEAGEDTYFDHQLDNLTWGGEPLFLMMAGLLSAKHGVRHVLALSRTDLAFDLAERELERIGRAGGDNASRVAFLRHMAAYVTLCYGLSRTALEEAIDEERHATKRDAAGDAASLADLLIDVLPGAADEAAPILPDMIGEAACLLALGEGSDIVLRAFERERTQVPATVIRAAQDLAGQERNGKEISAPLTWMDALIERNLVDVDQLMLIANQLPQTSRALVEHHARLDGEIGRIMSQRVENGDTNALPLLATSLNNLANTLSDLGRWEDALEAAEEAVSLRSRLAGERPDTFIPNLAASLNNLANILSDLGRREEALEAAEEAVSLYRRLPGERPDAFIPNLATSLNNLANILSDLGRREEALEAAEEAVSLYRHLAGERPDAFIPDLAMSLNNLANRLSELGRREEALDAAEEAVSLYRRLAGEKPDAFIPDLAMSLNNLAAMLSELGRREEALEAAEEAVSLRRRLADERLDAFIPDLAGSLNNLANRLGELGRREEALEAAEEAVSLRRRLADERPDAFIPNLAGSLNNLAAMLSELGRREEALDAAEEAVSLYRHLAGERPDAFEPYLAQALRTLADRLEETDRREDALVVNSDAISKLRRSFLNHPPSLMHWMMPACKRYIQRCDALGETPDEELLGPIVEAIQAMEKKE